MKRKFLSVFLLMCIVFSTLPTTAFAASNAKILFTATDDNGNTVKKAKVGDTITFTVSTTGDTTGLTYSGCAIGFNFNADELSFDEDSFYSDYSFNGACGATVADSGDIITFQLSPNGANKNDAMTYYNNVKGLQGRFIIGSVKAKILPGSIGKTIMLEKNKDTSMCYSEIKKSTKIKIMFQNHEYITTVAAMPSIKVAGISVESVSLSNSYSSLQTGHTYAMFANIFPANASDKSLTWSSGNTKVATVNANGVVTPHKPGTAKITAKSTNGKSASCTVTVTSGNKIEYDDYRYDFGNKPTSFGYNDNYKIPYDRYMQLGFSMPKAREKVRKNSGWDGNCFGMSTSSVLFYKNILQEEHYNANVHTPSEFDDPNAGDLAFLSDKWEVKLRHMIELFQISQCLGYYCYPKSNYSMGTIVDIIKSEINSGNPVLLGMNGYKKDNKSKTAGHAIVIYDYDVSNIGTRFYLYDCSDFVDSALYADGYTDFAFHYKSDKYVWNVCEIIPFEFIMDKYNFLYNQGDNAVSLFSLEEEPTYTYMFAPAGDFTITNSSGQVSKITDSEVAGEIEDVRLTMSSYLAENPTYTIILPTDEYTITGVGDEEITTSFADDFMSISVTAKAGTPVKISSDLKTIGVDTADGDEYSVQYTVYDNIFDEMTLSGTAGGALSSVLDESQVTVSGIKTLTAAASVSGTSISASSEDLESDGEVTVKCEGTDAGATIQILSEEKELTEKAALPERLKADAPVGSLESGTYEEGQTLAFEKDDETVIYYTTDGTVPSADNGIIYALPIDVNKTMTIKAISTKYGYSDSDVTELNYILPEITVPKANIASGEYDDVIKVELSTDDYNDDIYYTVNGENPLTDGMLYTTPLTFCESTCLKAYTLKNGCVSEIVTYEYTITPKNPFYFSNSLTNQDGEIITADNLAELTKIRLTLSKLQSGEHTALFFAAFYDADDKLVCIKSKNAVISKDTDEVEIDIEDDVSSAYTIKTFAVKDLSTMQPMCGAFEDNVISE